MGPFFNVWRRKAGVAMLVVALTIMACWARSYVVRDVITTVPLFGQGHTLSSQVGVLEWVSWKANYPRPQFPAGWRSQRLSYTKLGRMPLFRRVKFQMVTVSLAGTMAEGFATPLWLFALPPTLLSGYLILWKPRGEQRAVALANSSVNSD
jgi:hypothetical protein